MKKNSSDLSGAQSGPAAGGVCRGRRSHGGGPQFQRSVHRRRVGPFPASVKRRRGDRVGQQFLWPVRRGPSETADYTEIVFEKAGKIHRSPPGDFSLAVDQDGRVWGWGNNNAAQLGFTGPADSPGYPSMFTKPRLCGYDAKAIAAGDRFCVILDGDGAVYTTGDRSAGRKKGGLSRFGRFPDCHDFSKGYLYHGRK